MSTTTSHPLSSTIELPKLLTYAECKERLAAFSSQVRELHGTARNLHRTVDALASDENTTLDAREGQAQARGVSYNDAIKLRLEIRASEKDIRNTLMGIPRYTTGWRALADKYNDIASNFLEADVKINRISSSFHSKEPDCAAPLWSSCAVVHYSTTAKEGDADESTTSSALSPEKMKNADLEVFLRDRELNALHLLNRADILVGEDRRRVLAEATVELQAAREAIVVSTETEKYSRQHHHWYSQVSITRSDTVIQTTIRLRALEERLEHKFSGSGSPSDGGKWMSEEEDEEEEDKEVDAIFGLNSVTESSVSLEHDSLTSGAANAATGPKIRTPSKLRAVKKVQSQHARNEDFLPGSGIDGKELRQLFKNIFEDAKLKKTRKTNTWKERKKKSAVSEKREGRIPLESHSPSSVCLFSQLQLQAFTDRNFYIPLKSSEDIFVSELLCEILLYLPIGGSTIYYCNMNATTLSSVCLVSKAWYERARCLPHWQHVWDTMVERKVQHQPPQLCLGEIDALVQRDKKLENVITPSVARITVGSNDDYLHGVIQTREQYIAHRQEGLKRAFTEFEERKEHPIEAENSSIHLTVLRLAIITMIPLALGILFGGHIPESTLLGGTAGLVIGCQIIGSILFGLFIYCTKLGARYLSPRFPRSEYQEPLYQASNIGTAFLSVQYFQRLLGVLVIVVAVAFSRAAFIGDIVAGSAVFYIDAEQPSLLNDRSAPSPYLVSWKPRDFSSSSVSADGAQQSHVHFNETNSMLTFTTTTSAASKSGANNNSSSANTISYYLYKDDCASYGGSAALESYFEKSTGIMLTTDGDNSDSNSNHSTTTPSTSVDSSGYSEQAALLRSVAFRTAKGIPGGGFWGSGEVPSSSSVSSASPSSILLPCHPVPVGTTPETFLLQEKTAAYHLSWMLLGILIGCQVLCLASYLCCLYSIRRGRQNLQERVFGARDSLSSADLTMISRLTQSRSGYNNSKEDSGWRLLSSPKTTLTDNQVPLRQVEAASRLLMKPNPNKYLKYDLPNGMRCMFTVGGFLVYFGMMITISVIGGLCGLESSDEFRSFTVGKMTCSLVSYPTGGITMLVFGILSFVAGPLAVVFLGVDRVEDE